jgi:hypothetical protein
MGRSATGTQQDFIGCADPRACARCQGVGSIAGSAARWSHPHPERPVREQLEHLSGAPTEPPREHQWRLTSLRGSIAWCSLEVDVSDKVVSAQFLSGAR